MKKQIKIAFAMFACAALSFIFAGVYAADKPTINMTTGGDFYVGEAQDFTISTEVPDGYEEVIVLGDGVISDESAIEKLEYFEVKNSTWYELETMFGEPTGFPLKNATSKFKVTFNKAGEYTVTYGVKKVDGGEVIAENTIKIKVYGADERNVATAEELVSAINNADVKTINVTKDITTTGKTTIARDVTINGNGHKITIGKNTAAKWEGLYVLQAYKCNVTLKDITLTGGEAGLLVQGSKVIVKGTIDVSGNEYGGIELAKAGDAMPSLDLTNAKVVNTTEAYKLPTIWEDPAIDEDIVVIGDNNLEEIGIKAANGNNQDQYYLDQVNTADTPENQLKDQIDAGETDIVIDVFDTNATISKDVLNKLKGTDANVTIYSYDYVIEFNAKDMTDEFTKDLTLQIEVTDEQPFKSNVLKDVKADMVFIDLDYSGVLPKGTKITIRASDFGYKEGDKFMLYYYNPTTDAMELIAKEVVVDEYDYATIEIDHASTYVLSNAELPAKAPVANPNTSDMTMVIAISLGVIALVGFGYVTRTKLLTNKK